MCNICGKRIAGAYENLINHKSDEHAMVTNADWRADQTNRT